MRSLFELADAVIVHCDVGSRRPASRRWRGRRSGADKIAVIPHGHYQGAYPDTITRAEARAAAGPAGRGQGHRVRGLGALLQGRLGAAGGLRPLAGPDARLVIAGRAVDGAYAARLTAAAKGDERIHLDLGFVPDEDLQVYLRAADVVAAPFLEIFTSGSVLLAMSFERAVIAPRRGCVVDVLDEAGGILYDADDPQGLEGALRVAMTADLEAMGRHNGDGLERFDWRRVAEATRELSTGPRSGARPRRLRTVERLGPASSSLRPGAAAWRPCGSG